MLQLEEESIRSMCQDIIAVKPDVVVTEKGISGNENSLTHIKILKAIVYLFTDVAAHYLAAAGISAVRRTKKSDNNRISRATGATIVNDTGDLKEDDVGTRCGLFEIRKIGDEYVQYSLLFVDLYVNETIYSDIIRSSINVKIQKLVRLSCVAPIRMLSVKLNETFKTP
jgi:hypothetical protein